MKPVVAQIDKNKKLLLGIFFLLLIAIGFIR